VAATLLGSKVDAKAFLLLPRVISAARKGTTRCCARSWTFSTQKISFVGIAEAHPGC